MKNASKRPSSKSDYELGPELPNSRDAERAILGAILLDNQCWGQVELLRPEEFYLHAHQFIFTRMVELAKDGKPIDFVTLTECLGMHKQIEAVGGVVYVTSLTDGLPRIKNIEQYVDIVKKKAALRSLIRISTDAIAEAYEQAKPADEIIREVDRKICEIQGQGKGGLRHASVVVDEIKQEFNRVRAIKSDCEVIGFPTGIPSLNRTILGYHRGEMVLIAGETSHGKSVTLRQGVFANIFEDTRVGVYTYEVYGRSFITNLLSPTTNISGTKLRDFRLLEDNRLKGGKSEIDIFNSQLEQVKNWPLWIEDDSRNNHIDHICASARAGIRRHGIQMIFLDQVSLVRGTGSNETERMEYISKSLVQLAHDENVAVIALSQFNRDKERQGGKRPPRKGDVKQASRLEEDASCEIFVWEEEIDRHWLIVAKQRNGPTAKLPVTLDRAILWFEDGHK